jgi:hypothetical protein
VSSSIQAQKRSFPGTHALLVVSRIASNSAALTGMPKSCQCSKRFHNHYNVVILSKNMATLRFEWDEKKSRINTRKHGVSFDEAKTVFYDDYARLIDDPEHSEDEERFILLGFSASLRLLVVCHCYLDEDSVIRIISARKATSHEALHYKER